MIHPGIHEQMALAWYEYGELFLCAKVGRSVLMRARALTTLMVDQLESLSLMDLIV